MRPAPGSGESGSERRPSRVRAARFALALLCAWPSLTACRPLYLPPVPATIEAEERVELSTASRLRWDGGRLRLDLAFAAVPRSGWLAVQWYAPNGTEVAADSTWIEPSDTGRTRSLFAPPDVVETEGRWQVVVSFEGEVVRQVSTR